VLSRTPDLCPPDIARAPPPILALEGVTKLYGRPGPLARLLPGAGEGFRALDAVDLAVETGGVLGIVGESGSGKSTLAHVAVGLTQPTAGTVRLGGQDRAALAPDEARAWRRAVQIVFQDPNGALNPRKTVRRCLGETLALTDLPRAGHEARSVELLGMVGLGAEALGRLPHQLSGGQRQRVGLARALAMEPRLLIADEPVASLDVSLQAQVVNLLIRLTRELGLTLVFISHDLALVRRIATRVVVMQRGRIVEDAPAAALFAAPSHPYTRTLLAAVPKGLAGRRAASISAGNRGA
jgi:ABC-type glutathione transport system ATPase component